MNNAAAQTPARPPKSTRHAILDILKREGPQDARTLAERLNVTPMAVSLQLGALEKEKVVDCQTAEEGEAKPKRGRPKQLWRLTEAANRAFPDAHALLAVGLLNSLQQVYGEKGMQKLLDERTRQQIEEYRQAVPAEAGLKRKVKALAEQRDREGYMTQIEAGPKGAYLLIENHCPICTAAKTCQGFCQSEQQVFQALMGADATVTREEHLLSGDRRCVYAIKPSTGGKK